MFHTLGSILGLEANSDEHRRVVSMFQQATKYSTQMTNIILGLSDLETRNK
jgi:hypothetical protein